MQAIKSGCRSFQSALERAVHRACHTPRPSQPASLPPLKLFSVPLVTRATLDAKLGRPVIAATRLGPRCQLAARVLMPEAAVNKNNEFYASAARCLAFRANRVDAAEIEIPSHGAPAEQPALAAFPSTGCEPLARFFSVTSTPRSGLGAAAAKLLACRLSRRPIALQRPLNAPRNRKAHRWRNGFADLCNLVGQRAKQLISGGKALQEKSFIY